MPIKRSSFKDLRKSKRRRMVNLARGGELKTTIKRFEKLVSEKKADEAKALFSRLVSMIDRAASRGLLHKNNASRKVMRLAKMMNALSKA